MAEASPKTATTSGTPADFVRVYRSHPSEPVSAHSAAGSIIRIASFIMN